MIHSLYFWHDSRYAYIHDYLATQPSIVVYTLVSSATHANSHYNHITISIIQSL